MTSNVEPGDWIRIYEVLDPHNKQSQMFRQLIYEGLLLDVSQRFVVSHIQAIWSGYSYPMYRLLQVDGCVKEAHLRYDGHKPGVGEVRYDIERVCSGA